MPQATSKARLNFTQVTNAGLPHISALGQLEDLSLCVTGVNDVGLKELHHLTSLKKLALCGEKITDVGLAVATLSQLTNLYSTTGVTDAGLKELAALKKLESLNLGRTAVTNEGLNDLVTFRQLKGTGSGVRGRLRGIKTIQRALPNCWIPPLMIGWHAAEPI